MLGDLFKRQKLQKYPFRKSKGLFSRGFILVTNLLVDVVVRNQSLFVNVLSESLRTSRLSRTDISSKFLVGLDCEQSLSFPSIFRAIELLDRTNVARTNERWVVSCEPREARARRKGKRKRLRWYFWSFSIWKLIPFRGKVIIIVNNWSLVVLM